MRQLTHLEKEVKRLEQLREAVGIECWKLEAKDGDLVIVSPKKDDVKFSRQYCEWLAEALNHNLPKTVRIILLADNDTKVVLAQPQSEEEAYLKGWNDALKSIQESNSNVL